MRICLHIGLEHTGSDRLQKLLAAQRDGLRREAVLFPRAPGNGNHTRLFMAVTGPGHIDPLRFNRGHITAEKQETLRRNLTAALAKEVAEARPDVLILSACQLGTRLHRRSELERLRDLLLPLSEDIRVVAHVDRPSALMARAYAGQVFEGRALPLSRELELAAAPDWRQACLEAMPLIDPQAGLFEETQGPAFWLDFAALQAQWEAVFGAGSVSLRPYDEDLFYSSDAAGEICAAFGLERLPGRCKPVPVPAPPSAATLARGRQFNALLLQVLARKELVLPRPLWRALIGELEVAGEPVAPGSLAALDHRFAEANAALAAQHPALGTALALQGEAAGAWREADPARGFRATQYLLAFLPRIEAATKEQSAAKTEALKQIAAPDPAPVGTPSRLPPKARALLKNLKGGPYAPHNRIALQQEAAEPEPYTEVLPRHLPEGRSGNVIVGCMKNEAPYIAEWVAYHRAIGIDNFLIYTNGCEDGTAEILGRLQTMGVLVHRNNDDWKGNSPQQHALNSALKEPLLQNADWIIHIDVDEFINVRCGNGTLQDFLDRVPDATNVAMTWRLFGHNGVTRLADDFVIRQFDACAPAYCPKPHTAWGFKTMVKNIGAYGKLSCHRPNKLAEDRKGDVRWVNGAGRDMTAEAAERGWRNSRASVGYDLLQLNHYALRSAESFLVKRQRGRALHVDRSIGLNYWIRMDWNDHRDRTIQRNLPRMQAEYRRLMQDGTLRRLHEEGLAWHRAKAEELRKVPEFAELYAQALRVELNATERAAYALALDMES
ncbi:glycosyltransferase family 2 protein [Cribrihabitans neustonicus]|uniref:glycosyltransferase family 2 protein n=1 Tax=Cribrihabitans neustonicus TaxID=1429085 RepID=UPI003B5BF9B8